MTKAPTFTVPAPRRGGALPPKKDPRVLPSDPMPGEAEDSKAAAEKPTKKPEPKIAAGGGTSTGGAKP